MKTLDLAVSSLKHPSSGRLWLWFWLSLALAGAVWLNLWIYAHRSEGFLFYETSYGLLYHPRESLRITDFRKQAGNKLAVQLNQKSCREWIVQAPGQPAVTTQPVPILTLVPGRGHYRGHCRTQPGQRFELGINYTPQKGYRQIRSDYRDNYLILNSSLPIGTFEQTSLQEWMGYYGAYSEQDLLQSRRILRQEIGVRPDEPTLSKLEKIGTYLLSHYYRYAGTPDQELASLDPPKMQAALDRDGAINGRGIWCTQFAALFTHYAKVAGIPSRRVFATGALSEVSLSGHAIAESYIAEQQRWAYMDLSSRKFFVFDPDTGLVLNTLDLFFYHQSGSQKRLRYRTLAGDEVVSKPYVSPAADIEQDYFHANTVFQFARPVRDYYSPLNRLRRYLISPDPAFSFHPFGNRHHLKYAALALLAIIGLLWLLLSRRLLRGLRIRVRRLPLPRPVTGPLEPLAPYRVGQLP